MQAGAPSAALHQTPASGAVAQVHVDPLTILASITPQLIVNRVTVQGSTG